MIVSPRGFLSRLLDHRTPFSLYFCVREKGHTGFRIDRDAGRPWHLLYIPESGELRASFPDTEIDVRPGQALWIQPGARFRIRGPRISPSLGLSVCRFHLRDRSPPRLAGDFLMGRVPPGEPMLDELRPGHEAAGPVEDLRLRAVLGRLLCRAFFPLRPDADSGLSPAIRDAVVAFAQQRIRDRLPAAALATHAGMNPDYFSRQFKRTFGVPPQTWIKRLRIREAADHLLASPITVSAVAERFGYDSVPFFSRQFREVMGVGPRSWLARHGDRAGR